MESVLNVKLFMKINESPSGQAEKIPKIKVIEMFRKIVGSFVSVIISLIILICTVANT